ncbi:hypothetical protein PSHT_02648 [Puccinia striiformis]|uniref:Uncharacterized protein n=1 Tax=Puccinia striiformis TaxID=27350 RepID=A0A2S4WHH1_9BASI|nr:hypothetical protein PSHT_02648 [Puccinia striiformis]
MSGLPFSVDMEGGFESMTPLRHGPYASTSHTQQPNFDLKPPPLKKTQPEISGKHGDMSDQYQMDKTTPNNDRPPGTPHGPPTGYDLYNVDSPEDFLDEEPRIIKDSGLFYDGKHFMKFLERFERTALAYQASGYDKALQILWFIGPEELKVQLEAMDGYDDFNWTTLRKSMIDSWGELDNTILYTNHDLAQVTHDIRNEGGLKNYGQYKTYLGKFTPILKYLVNNGHLYRKEEASRLFLSAFSIDNQRSIKRALVSAGKLPKGKDGSEQPPLWEHATAAAEITIRVMENGGFGVSNSSESGYQMHKSLDHQRQDYSCNNERCLTPGNDKSEFSTPQEKLTPLAIRTSTQTINWQPSKLGSEDFLETHTVTRLEGLEGRRGVRNHNLGNNRIDVNQEDKMEEPPINIEEPLLDLEEPPIEFKKPPMDVEDAASPGTTQHMEINLMDIPMTLTHTVINIPDITMEEMDMFQQINAQSGMQEKETTHLNNVSLDQVNLKMGKTTYWVHNVNKLKDRITNRNSFKSHLSQYMKYSSTPTLEKPMDVADTVMDVADTVMDVADTVMDVADTVMDVADTVFGLMANTKDFEKRKMDVEDMKINLEDILIKDIGYIKMVPGAAKDDNQCSTKPTIYWIHNVNKLKEKIFNKHLFKPHSSLFKYVQIFCVPQKFKLKETERGADEGDLISISVPITITKAAAINSPVHPIPAVLPIIPEECFPNPPPPVPPDTTQPPGDLNDRLVKETAITTFSSDKSINNQWRCQLNKVNYLLLFYLLHNFDSQIPPQIKPEGIGQLYSKVGFQRILVGVG